MPSRSLLRWQGERAEALVEIEGAHASVGGSGPGRRYATQQLNHAYAMLLSSQFQGFCRDLHSECVEFILAAIPVPLQRITRVHNTPGVGCWTEGTRTRALLDLLHNRASVP